MIYLYILIVFVQTIICSGWINAEARSSYKGHDTLGLSILFSLIISLCLPILGVFTTYMASGFAHYGWTLKGYE